MLNETTVTEPSKNTQVVCITPLNVVKPRNEVKKMAENSKKTKSSKKSRDSTKIKELTQKEIKKMEKVFSDMDSEMGSLGLSLLSELSFALQTLKKLKADIRKNGVVVDMPQGNYSIKRANPALQAYNTLIKNYQSIVKAIQDMLPLAENAADIDEFDSDNL